MATLPTPSDEQIAELEDLLSESSWKHTYTFGSRRGNDRNIKPCIRIQDNTKTESNPLKTIYGGWTLKAYQASYIAHTKQLPNGNISHYCASPYPNRGKYYNSISLRSIKRDKLKKYNSCIVVEHMTIESQEINVERRTCHNKMREWEKKNRWRYNNINGPLFLSVIQQFEDEMNNISEREIRLRERKGETYYKCKHNDTCFINYGRWEYNDKNN